MALSGLSMRQALIKRMFDFFVSLFGLIIFLPLIITGFLLATIDTRSFGFFIQHRVGLNGRLFRVIKLKTMSPVKGITTTVTSVNDPRITRIGGVLRKYKLDELPQLVNVLLGQMSFVGPRPDVAGFADKLIAADRVILSVRPGITGPATIKYKNEEEILSLQQCPEDYNAQVIFPDKVKINLEYIKNWTLLSDVKYILKTVLG